MVTDHSNTSSGGWILIVSNALEALGCDSNAIFAKAGINLSDATDPNSRFSVKDMTKVWACAVAETGNDAIGLEAAVHYKPTSFHALGYSILASTNLKEAFLRLAKYTAVVSNAGKISVTEELQRYKVCLERSVDEDGTPLISDEALDAFIACLIYICRYLYHSDFSPLLVELERPAPLDVGPYENAYGCSVVFSMPESSIYIAKVEMDRELPTGDAELAYINDQVIVNYLARLERGDVVGQVQAKIIETLPGGESSQEAVAAALNLSLRSLQRKLQLAGTSYSEEYDKVRMHLAKKYLNQSHRSIVDVSFMLGFKNLSSFSRAFKRWTGMSPARYRIDQSRR